MSDIAKSVKLLAQKSLDQAIRVTTAESCTGGWIAKSLTDLPGSSAWFEYGFVVYSNEAKTRLLGVPTEILEQHGAVSEAVVDALVRGALRVSGADLAVAVSGVAGPDGGSPEKPVGTVWLAWGKAGSGEITTHCRQFLFSGDRESVRSQTVVQALDGLIDMLD